MREIDQQIQKRLKNKKGTAYELTKLACQEYEIAGYTPPAWPTLNEVIGKGAAQDINRGKKDFRNERAELMGRAGNKIDGVPESLQVQMRELWESACEAGYEQWKAERQAIEDEQKEIKQAMALSERDSVHNRQLYNETVKEAEGLRKANTILEKQLKEESITNQKQLILIQNIQNDAKNEKEALQATIDQLTSELNKANKRADGAEQHAYKEIERVRTESREKIKKDEAKYQSQIDQMTLNNQNQTARLEDENHALLDKVEKISEEKVQTDRENTELTTKLSKLETDFNSVQASNNKLNIKNEKLFESKEIERQTYETKLMELIQAHQEERSLVDNEKNSTITKLQNQIEKLNKQNAIIDGDLKDRNLEVTRIASELKRLHNSNNELNDALGKANKRLEKYMDYLINNNKGELPS